MLKLNKVTQVHLKIVFKGAAISVWIKKKTQNKTKKKLNHCIVYSSFLFDLDGLLGSRKDVIPTILLFGGKRIKLVLHCWSKCYCEMDRQGAWVWAVRE